MTNRRLVPVEATAEPRLARSQAILLGLSYLMSSIFFLGAGPFLALLLAFVFRRERFFFVQLLQAAYALTPVWLLGSILMLGGSWELFQIPPQSPLYAEQRDLNGLCLWLFEILNACLFVVLAWKAFMGEPVRLMLLHKLACYTADFLTPKKYKRAALLNAILPGSGQLYFGQSFWGWVLVGCFLTTASVLAVQVLAYFQFPLLKDLLTFTGFYFRLPDGEMVSILTNPGSMMFFGLLLAAIHWLAQSSLWQRTRYRRRLLFASFGVVYILQTALLCVLLLVPFVFSFAQNQEAISERSQKILKELQELKRQEQREHSIKPQTKPRTIEQEISFDLTITQEIQGLNEFSGKPFARPELQSAPKPKLSYASGQNLQEISQEIQQSNAQDASTHKSYSEYITAKIREGARDQLIWDKTAQKPYAVIVQYTIEHDGHISAMKIIEGSHDLEIDAVVLAVIESMDPVVPPPNNTRLHVTELFWNTGSQEELQGDLKSFLANYPDGRVIQAE